MNRRSKIKGFVLSGRRGGLTAALLAVLISALFSGVALAHAAFVRSQPAPNSVLTDPPSAVTIWFTESVSPDLSEIAVLDSRGQRVNNEAATSLPGDSQALKVNLPKLPNGIYTVAWKSFSASDGHTLAGSFVFSVGEALPTQASPSAPSPAQPLIQSPFEVVLRWLRLLSILAIVGTLVFDLFITRTVFSLDNATEDMQRMERRMESRTLSFVSLSSGIFAAASVGELVARTSVALGIPLLQTFGRPLALVLRTAWGNFWVWRMAVLFGMAVVLMLVSRERSKTGLSGRREWEMVALPFALGIVLTISLVSHGAAIRDIRLAAIFSDYLHMLAASVWIGGIFYLALVIPPVMKAQREQAEGKRSSRRRAASATDPFCPPNHIAAIGRFSALAMLSVGTLFITGLFNAWAQVTVPPALATRYGNTLLVKLGLIAPLLLLGAINLLWVRPRLARDGAALRVLRRTITAEAILVILIILLVGVLTGLEPAREAVSRQAANPPDRLELKSSSEGVNFKTEVEPGTLGQNFITVFLTDQSGAPITNAKSVALELTYLDQSIAPYAEDTVFHGSGIWVAHGVSFTVAGTYQASLTVQRPGAFDARTSYKFRIPLTAESTAVTLDAKTGRRLWGIELVLLGILFGGVGLYAGGRKTQPGTVSVSVAVIAIIAGVILALVSLG